MSCEKKQSTCNYLNEIQQGHTRLIILNLDHPQISAILRSLMNLLDSGSQERIRSPFQIYVHIYVCRLSYVFFHRCPINKPTLLPINKPTLLHTTLLTITHQTTYHNIQFTQSRSSKAESFHSLEIVRSFSFSFSLSFFSFLSFFSCQVPHMHRSVTPTIGVGSMLGHPLLVTCQCYLTI